MNDEQFGVETIKRAVGIVIALGMDLEDHLADDNKISLSEAASTVIEVAPDIFAVASKAGELKSELKDWDQEERVEVLEWAIIQFDLDNDKAEKAVETALTVLVKIGELISLLKKEEE